MLFLLTSGSCGKLFAQKNPTPQACNCNILIPASTTRSVTCNGGNDGSVTANGINGGATCDPETYEYYEWYDSGSNLIGTNATISGLSAGVYTVFWENDNCFGVTKTVTITQPAAITGNINKTNETCNQNDGTVTVSGVAGGIGSYTYSWTFNGTPITGTSPGLIGCTQGTYACTIKDANNCSTVLSISVGNSGTPVTASASVNNHVSCYNGSNGSATATASGGGGAPYTYSWSPSGGNAATANNLAPGTYTVTITGSNGCVDLTPDVVTITQPSAAITIASTGMIPVSCNGGSNGQASVSGISGGTGSYTYSWSPSGGNAATAVGLAAGFYTCTVRDANNCSVVSSSIQVTQFPAVTGSLTSSSQVSCYLGNDGSATVTPGGGNGGYTYSWSPLGGNQATANNLAAGTYACTITDANNCAAIVSNISITQPQALTASASQNSPASCGQSDGSASVVAGGGTPGYTYLWQGGGGGASKSGLAAGSYTVGVWDNNGCYANDNVIIASAGGGPSANATVVANVTCNGGNNGAASVTASGGSLPYTYSWSPSGGAGSTASNLSAAVYAVTVTDGGGCVITKTVSITQPTAITASMTTTPAACATGNGTATAMPSGGTGAFTYSWNTVPVQITQTATGLISGTYSVTVRDANNCSKIFSATVGTAPSPLVTFSTTSISCNGGASGSATATPSGGGGPPYTYSWSTNPVQTTASVSGLAAGTYTVNVSTATCANTVTVAITQPAVLSAAMTTTPTPCLQSLGSARATVSGGTGPFTYSWNPTAQTTQTATGLTAGFYSVTVTDKNSCTKVFSTVVNNTNGPAVNAVPSSTSCFGSNDGSAVVNATGGTAPYSYAWSPSGGTSSAASNLSAQVYSATVSDAAGCVTTVTVSITQPTQILPNITSTSIAVCRGSQAPIITNATGGTPGYTYNWNPSADLDDGMIANPVAGPTITTTYSVLVTDTKGCTGTGSVTVTVNNLPVINAGPASITICNGTSTTMNATGGITYVWSPSSGLSNTTVANPIINPTTAITYSLVGTDSNGCSNSDTIRVVTAYVPPVITVSSTYSTICIGSSVDTLKATGGSAYFWSDGLTTQTTSSIVVSPDVSTTYTVTVTNSIGCTGTSTISINVTSGFPAPLVAPNGPFSFCVGDSLPTFTATPNPSTNGIGWTFNSNYSSGTTFTPSQNLAAGTYPLYCVQGTGTSCLSNPTVSNIIIHPLPAADAGNGTTVCPGFSAPLNGSGGVSYLWTPSASLNNAAISNPSAEPELTTTYVVTVTDANTCRANDSVVVYVVLNDTCIIQVYNLISPNGDGDNDVWWIDGIKFFPDNNVKIFNRWGAKVWEGSGYDNDKVMWKGDNQNGAKLPVSTYYYIIELGSRTLNGFVELVE